MKCGWSLNNGFHDKKSDLPNTSIDGSAAATGEQVIYKKLPLCLGWLWGASSAPKL